MLIKKNDFINILKQVAEKQIGGFDQVILPVKSGYSGNGKTFFKDIGRNGHADLDSFRAVDPLKMLYYLTREVMVPENFESKKRIIAGVKACDLKALSVLDRALINKDFVDPNYYHWRNNTLIIASDCMETGDSCHCNLMDGKPYSEEHFDINLSALEDDYLVSAGSERGKGFLDQIGNLVTFKDAGSEDKERVSENRSRILGELKEKNQKFELEFKNYKDFRTVEASAWDINSKECVGCGGCTNICPTCYCLILNDETEGNRFTKVRSYDSCQYHGYARVAGGGTPRPRMHQRFRNRYLCKLDYMKENFDIYGCTGCGRCIDTCPAEIEFREVIKNISEVVPAYAEKRN